MYTEDQIRELLLDAKSEPRQRQIRVLERLTELERILADQVLEQDRNETGHREVIADDVPFCSTCGRLRRTNEHVIWVLHPGAYEP
jgi:hypothetical protein